MVWRFLLDGSSSTSRGLRFLLLVPLMSGTLAAAAAQGPSPEKPLTAAQQQRLKERDRFSDESAKFEKQGKLLEAIAAAEKMLAIEREVFGNEHLDVAGSLGRLADMRQQREEFAVARKQRQEALAIKIRLLGTGHWKVTDARLALADVDILAGLTPEDRKALDHCRELMNQVRDLSDKKDYSAALPLAKKVFDIRTRVLGPKHRLTAVASTWVGNLYDNLGQYADALPWYRNALPVEEEVFGKTHPNYARAVSSLGRIYYALHDYTQAEPLFREAIAARKAEVGPKHADYRASVTDLCDTLDHLATVAQGREEWGGERRMRGEILQLQTELYGEQDWRTIDARLTLADVDVWSGLRPEDRKALAHCDELSTRAAELMQQRDFAAAIPLAQEVLATDTRVLGRKHLRTAVAFSTLGSVYFALERYTDAEPLYQQALQSEEELLGKNHPKYATCLNNLGNLYAQQGNYAKAESLDRQAIAIRKAAFGAKDASCRTSETSLSEALEALATAAVGRAEWDAARKSRGEVLRLQTEMYGERDWHATDARLALADVDIWAALSPEDRKALSRCDEEMSAVSGLVEKGSAEAALAQAKNVFETRTRVLGKQHRLTALANTWLGRVYDGLGQYANAEPFYQQAMDVNKKVLGEGHPSYATSVSNMAFLYQSVGNYARAEPLFRQALEIRKQALGEKHREYASSLNNLAALYDAMGDYARAETLYRQALDLTAQAVGEKDSDYARGLNNLAYLCDEMGDYPRSLKLYRRAAEIYKQAAGEKYPMYATSLNNLASVYKTMGDLAAAEPLYRQSLEIRKQVLGEKHPDYAASLNNLAELYGAMGDEARAEPLLRQSLQVELQIFGNKHPQYAASLSNLAVIYYDNGDYARAKTLFLQALQIRKQTLGEKHPDYAVSLNCLGKLYSRTGDYKLAEPLFRQSLEIFKQKVGEKHPDYAADLNNLAALYLDMGDYARAEPLYRQSLEIYKQTLGEKHYYYAGSLNNLAMLLLRMHKPQDAVGPAGQAVNIIRSQLDATADVQSESQQLAMNETLRWCLNNFLSATAAANSLGKDVYPAVLAWKGAVTARQQAIQRMREAQQGRLDPRIAEVYHELTGTTAALANLSRTVPKPAEVNAYRNRLQQLHDEIESLQQKLAAASASYRHELALRRRTPDDVRRALPAQTALVDLLEYWHTDPPEKNTRKAVSQNCLAAFVVRQDAPVERIELGPAQPIEQAIAVWRWRNIPHPPVASLDPGEKKTIEEALAAWKKDQQDAEPAGKLREWVWDKLEPHLNGAKTVLLSPDGATAQFPWPALPGTKPGSYLIEDVALAVVPIPSMLPELLASQAPSSKPSATPSAVSAEGPAPSLLLVGDVNFDADPGKSPPEMVAMSAARGSRDGGLHHWPALPGTRTEMAAIADSFEEEFSDAKMAKLRGDKATKQAVVAALTNHRYVHLATHGFFAPHELKSTIAAAGRGSASELLTRQDVAGFHPGLLSGLVLAGANHPPSEGHDDGILTALEVAQLDLGKLDLVTLSACETGLGDTAGGEGVLGLQRAFQVAGAKTVVATLWTIDDDASRSLMVDFYENLWKKKLPKLEALRQAQLRMLRDGIKRGMIFDADHPPDKQRRLPPFYWAAFELSGDWR